MTTDRRSNRIIGKYFVNGTIKLIGLPEVWGSILPYIFNAVISEYRGWGSGGCTGTESTISTSKTGVEPSETVLLNLQGVLFSPVLYTVVIDMTSSIVGNLSSFGSCTTPVLMIKTGWLLRLIIIYLGGFNTGTSYYLILIFPIINTFWWVFLAVSPTNLTCMSLMFAQFKFYPTSFIVKFSTLLIILSLSFLIGMHVSTMNLFFPINLLSWI